MAVNVTCEYGNFYKFFYKLKRNVPNLLEVKIIHWFEYYWIKNQAKMNDNQVRFICRLTKFQVY